MVSCNHDNVSELGDISIRGQKATDSIKYKHKTFVDNL